MIEGVDILRRSPLGTATPAIGLGVVAVLVGIAFAAVGPVVGLPVLGALFFAGVVMWPQYGIAMFLSTFLMTYPQGLQGSGFLSINNVLGAIFLMLLTYRVYRERDWWFVRTPELQILAGIIALYYVSGQVNGPDPRLVSLMGFNVAFSDSLYTFVNRTAFVVFFISFIRAPEHVRMIYLLALVFMIITALTGIQSVMRGGGFQGYRATAGQSALISSAVNPNRLAMFAVLAIAGLYYFAQWLRIPGLWLLVVPTIAVLSLSVFMAASRSGLLGLGICAAAIFWDEGIELRRVLTFVLAGALLVTSLLQFVPEKGLERITNLPFTQAGEEGLGSRSLEGRRYVAMVALEMFEEHPLLGVGMGNWELTRYLHDPSRSLGAPHDSYLLALVEGGLPCLVGFLILLWRTWSNFRFGERYICGPNSRFPELAWIVKASKANLIVLLFFSAVADLWQLVILFWLIGLGIVLRRISEQALMEEPLAY